MTFWNSRWRNLVLGFGFWTVFALIEATQLYVSQSVYGREIPWSLAFRRGAEEWYTWAFLSFWVMWVFRKYPYDPNHHRRWVVFHLAAAYVNSWFFALIYSWILMGQRSIDGSQFVFTNVLSKVIIHYSCMHMIIYWGLLLGYHGLRFYRQFKAEQMQAAQLQTELVEARLQALRMQLNPHFLFNTLHTISSLIHHAPETADRMVARLSDLLRTSLDCSNRQEVPLSEELQFLKQYLDIEQIRFQERLTIDIKVDPALNDCLVPHLILQPIVENAVKHGVESREDTGCIEICAQRANGMLELIVRDNGPGLPAPSKTETKDRFDFENGDATSLNGSNHATSNGRQGIGLANTRSRLDHLYGANHRFDLVSRSTGGLEVRLAIPMGQSSSLSSATNGKH